MGILRRRHDISDFPDSKIIHGMGDRVPGELGAASVRAYMALGASSPGVSPLQPRVRTVLRVCRHAVRAGFDGAAFNFERGCR
jgi:hypothetical protein